MLDGEPLLLVRDVPGVDLGATDAALQGRDRSQVRASAIFNLIWLESF